MADNCPYHCQNGKVFMESLHSFVDCPHCGGLRKLVIETGDAEKEVVLHIPEAYKGSSINCDYLFAIPSIQNYAIAATVDNMQRTLDKISSAVYRKSLFHNSCYIYPSDDVDLRPWVYGVQKMALDKDMTVTPFISADMLFGLHRLMDYNNITGGLLSLKDNLDELAGSFKADITKQSLYMGYEVFKRFNCTYVDFITAELVFIEDTSDTADTAINTLKGLLEERARMDLPTYVISHRRPINTSVKGFDNRPTLINRTQVSRLDRLSLVDIRFQSKTGAEYSSSFDDRFKNAKEVVEEATPSDLLAGMQHGGRR